MTRTTMAGTNKTGKNKAGNGAIGAILSKSRLRQLAGEQYFARGEEYFKAGTVIRLQNSDEHGIHARVLGTQLSPYTVRLWRRGKDLDWGCTCPLGTDGEFCKHVVAAGLAFLAGVEIPDDEDDTDETASIREALDAMSREEMQELLFERATWDEDLAAELLLAGRAQAQKSSRKRKRANNE